MPDPASATGMDDIMGALGDLWPLDILESVIVSNLKVFGEQSAIEALLELSTNVSENHFHMQNTINQQAMLHNLTLAGTVKCLEIITKIDANAQNAPQLLRQCLQTIPAFSIDPGQAGQTEEKSPA